ncbi:TIGR03086 family metal-binding protein [Nonomuraea lactucae]|uniref:TIGR03086 family metal-binding protein n=1 Tax=Nonomuraea lactucae TaxID=2249762 RepID=UPI0019650AAC|nr:TIGR03086 family metal-binding protein [Nonomuraea lactucae]
MTADESFLAASSVQEEVDMGEDAAREELPQAACRTPFGGEATGGAQMENGVGLLERAIGYALGSLIHVTRDDLYRATPCGEWDVGNLLAHLDDSFAALHEAAELGHVDLAPGGGCGGGDPVLVLRDRAAMTLGAWAGTLRDHTVNVGGCQMAGAMVTAVGAVEVTVHAWDLAQACGRPHPIPPSMAAELLAVANLLVSDDDRPERFAVPVDLPSRSPAQDRLLAFLGRNPAWPRPQPW